MKKGEKSFAVILALAFIPVEVGAKDKNRLGIDRPVTNTFMG